MTSSETPGLVKQFRKTSWRFQATFVTPLKNLRPFVELIVSALQPVDEGRVTLDQIVFEPKNLITLTAGHSLAAPRDHDWSLSARGRKEIMQLLEAALGDCVDFAFVPAPRAFVMFADHDEYATFFGNTKSSLNRVVESLTAGGFEKVSNYERRF
jgi:hypothetical protein